MTDGPFPHLQAGTAAEVCQKIELDEEAVKQLTPAMTPAQFIDALTAKELYIDGCRFLAQALPKREAIWWALISSRLGPPPTPQGITALELAEKWIVEPTEDNRRPTQEAAEIAGLGTPAGLVAMAVFVSGGSVAPVDLAAVYPPEHMCGTVVGNTIIMAALLPSAVESPGKFVKLLGLGLEIARGTNRWPEAGPPADGLPQKTPGSRPGTAVRPPPR